MPVRHRIVRTLISVIFRGIQGLGNFLPTSEHFAVWQDEDRLILSMLANLLETEANPVLVVEVEDDLITIKHDPRHAVITADVMRLIEQLPRTLESIMIRYLRQGRIQRRLITNHGGATVDMEALDAAIETELHATLDDFFATYSTPDAVWGELERLLSLITDAGVQTTDSDFLLQQMCHHSPIIMMGVAELLVTHPDSRTLTCLPSLLTPLREENVQQVLACLQVAVESSSPRVRSMAVWAIAAPRAPANQEEQNMIRRFALDADRSTALSGILALSRFPSEREVDVIAILDQISVRDDGEIADRICLLFDAQNGIDPEHLPKPFVFRFLDQLVPLTDWSQLSHVSDFIDWITRAEPERAAAYYLARIAHQRTTNSSGYVAIPYQLYERPTQGHFSGDIPDSGARAQALRLVRDSLLSAENTPEIWEVTQIFSRLSLSDTPLVLDVILEWVDSNDPQRIINAAHLLPHRDRDFVFVHEEYVVHLLEMAHQYGATVFRQVQDAIIDSTQFGLSGGWGVGPHPEDVTLLTQATEVSRRYPQSHVAHAFYQRLMNIALEMSERSHQIDAMLEDE